MEKHLKYQMTEAEIKAYKIALLWDQNVQKLFPERRIQCLPKSGDPRKSTIFKYCWKLLRETRGLLKDDEYPLYIRGNLAILKKLNGYVAPNVICGDKAWMRWKAWKRLYDQKMREKLNQIPETSVTNTDPKIISQIDRTKKFVFELCDGNPTPQTLEKSKKKFIFWCESGKISVYYLILSPFVRKIFDLKQLEKDLSLELKVYEEKITNSVISYFKEEFSHEYQ